MRRDPVRRVALIALTCTAALLALAMPAAADGHRHGHKHRDRGHRHGTVTIVHPGQSIQAAIDAAGPGSIIVVKHGTYAENLVIKTDGIKLIGKGATLTPPATPAPDPCAEDPSMVDGICVIGQLQFPPNAPPTVTQPVSDVTIKGFTISGFSSTGIVFFGSTNPVVTGNQTDDDGGYGIARFVSSGGAIVGNEASGNAEAGIYVGDSPNANVLVAGNRSHDNQLFGFFFRDSANARAIGNESSGNCVGAIVLNTGGNVAGNWLLFANRIHDNDRLCPADPEEGSPPLSGIGVAIVNAHGNVVAGNVIRDNVPSGQVPFAGGVVIVNAGTPGAELPANNLVKGNVVLGNEPDLFWDGSGTNNVFKRNVCQTSTPDGLCGAPHGHDSKHHHRR
ncbi:MAG TPA: right-handed parallel beta-helix repeat-containing protein [Conexibacter sp.]|nr:right-handed parallel beta-helix repeat-containing protein [Conexibacter sp.]